MKAPVQMCRSPLRISTRSTTWARCSSWALSRAARSTGVLLPGYSLTFQLRAYELVGEGMMQWAPDHRHVVANSDYTVEND